MNFFWSDRLETGTGWAAALIVGLAFGFWLERAGFGSSRRLAAIFYLRDFTVLRVMFTALATAAVGLWALDAAGLIAIDHLYRMETRYLPAAVGGVLFGAGFVVGGWCPGTALVGVASARLDAAVFLAGAMGGSLLYAFAWPLVAPLQDQGACGVVTLPEVLSLPVGLVTAIVVGLALFAFALTHAHERRSTSRSESASS